MVSDIFEKRADYSGNRLTELRNRLKDMPELKVYSDLTVFGAGSYARLEASEYSDIDVFFLYAGDKNKLVKPRTLELQLFGKVIECAERMNFPEFSNDCEYLVVLHAEDIAMHLGGRRDDYENFFTARMLLLLESTCLYGTETYEAVTSGIINSYFKDFYDHPSTFQPIFLLNDICRFWRTLLINYENRRNLPSGSDEEHRKMKAKIRNFKLKYSRMTTCFASIAALGSHRVPVTEEQVLKLTKLTPRQRLQDVAERVHYAKPAVEEVLKKYAWFLEMTGLPTNELEEHFSDNQKRTEMFQNANDYGDSMFNLFKAIDEHAPELRLLRFLVL